MDTDLSLAIGLLIMALSVPSILAAVADGRAPRASAVTILIGGGLILYAIQAHPGGYKLADVPDVFMGVVARFLP